MPVLFFYFPNVGCLISFLLCIFLFQTTFKSNHCVINALTIYNLTKIYYLSSKSFIFFFFKYFFTLACNWGNSRKSVSVIHILHVMVILLLICALSRVLELNAPRGTSTMRQCSPSHWDLLNRLALKLSLTHSLFHILNYFIVIYSYIFA